MRNFDWGFRIAHIMGGIIEALIILVAVAVIAGLIFLLMRYLLVATRAAQLYVAQHEPPRPTNTDEPVTPVPAAPTTPAASPTPNSPTASAAPTATKPAPTTPVTTATTTPATKPRTPKTPPSK